MIETANNIDWVAIVQAVSAGLERMVRAAETFVPILRSQVEIINAGLEVKAKELAKRLENHNGLP